MIDLPIRPDGTLSFQDMSYRVEYLCVACRDVLTNEERLQSEGVCPKCGHVAEGDEVITYKTATLIHHRANPRAPEPMHRRPSHILRNFILILGVAALGWGAWIYYTSL